MRKKFKWLIVRSTPTEAEVYKAAAELDGSDSTSAWVRRILVRSAQEAAETALTDVERAADGSATL